MSRTPATESPALDAEPPAAIAAKFRTFLDIYGTDFLVHHATGWQKAGETFET